MKFNNELYRNIFIIAEIFIPAVITLLYFLITKRKYNKAVIDINENQRKFKKEIYILKILFVLIISILLIFGYCKFINHNFLSFMIDMEIYIAMLLKFHYMMRMVLVIQ